MATDDVCAEDDAYYSQFTTAPKVSSFDYYQEWNGHRISHLRDIERGLKKPELYGLNAVPKNNIIYLAGDSSLDNKAWFKEKSQACNGYETLLTPPRMKEDVCYWMNRELINRNHTDIACINTSVEATTLAERGKELWSHDEFIRERITENDILVVSVGGNDIALQPSPTTIYNMIKLVYLAFEANIENGTAWGLAHFIDLFKVKVEAYINELVRLRKPKKIVVCTIYFPDETSPPGGSWADTSLTALKYNSNPQRLQTAIRTIFQVATSEIRIPGVEVIPCPLFEVLDGKTTGDYKERVEPSSQGGQKMANFLLDLIGL